MVNNEVTRQRWATIQNLDRYNFLAESEAEAVNNTGMVVESEGRVVREIFRTSGLRERRPLLLGKPATVIDEPGGSVSEKRTPSPPHALTVSFPFSSISDNVLIGILRNQVQPRRPYCVHPGLFISFSLSLCVCVCVCVC